MEQLRDACGIVGIYMPQDEEHFDVRRYITLALTALQHRGQESAGMAVYDSCGQVIHCAGMGKVREVFHDSGTSLPPTHCGIGHVRYSTTGSSCVENAGPFVVEKNGQYDTIALAHNGNIVNGEPLRSLFSPAMFNSTTESEVIALLLLYAQGRTLRERMMATFPLLRGSYSLVMLAEGKLHAMRDPWGIRPLCIGRIGNTWIVVSESCALDRMGATYVREVEPGEFITIDESGLHSEILSQPQPPRQALCVFEHIYFSDATSLLNNAYVYNVREALGRELAREHPVDADLVVPVPDSSIPAALGYADEAGILYGQAIIKNRYSDRSFIKPDQRLRQLEIDLKFNFVQPKVEGARLIIVDDSIVRGNTMKRLVSALRNRGVKEIHLRSSAPPLRHPCYFGIDIPQESELIAAGRSTQQVADYIGVDSLGYLSLAGLGRAIHRNALGTTVHPEDAANRTRGDATDSNESQCTAHEDEQELQYLHEHFCYGCMYKDGWAFDPIAGAKHGVHRADFFPRDVVGKSMK
jgi:amidophosphoribosyltransferase